MQDLPTRKLGSAQRSPVTKAHFAPVRFLSCHLCALLIGVSASFLNMPLIACDAVKGAKVGEGCKSRCSAKQLHRPRAIYASRGLLGLTHGTISSISARCGGGALPLSGRELNSWQVASMGKPHQLR